MADREEGAIFTRPGYINEVLPGPDGLDEGL
jgi:hypothetical protein